MKSPLILTAAASLAACGQSAEPANTQTSANRLGSKTAPPAPAKAFAYEEKTDLIEFDYSWSAEAAAVPELVTRFRADLEKQKAELLGGAEEEKERSDKEGQEFHPHMSSTSYQAAGQSPRLLSLSLEAGGYEGGAHGNFGVGALLWERAAHKEIKFADLFAQPANRDRLLTQRWCDALNKAREEKRGEPVGGGGLFDDCPSLDEIAIIPADKDKNGRFERLNLVASPYLAGPWVEGAYEIELAVTPDLIAVLKRDYQPSFEAQGPQ
jgi:Deacetylase PdaC